MIATRIIKKDGTRLSALLALTLCIAWTACNDLQGNAEPGVVQQELGVSGGGVPLPISICMLTPEECEARGPEESWDGSYSELLAADAFAECTVMHAVGIDVDLFGMDADPWNNETDQFIGHIWSFMHGAMCPLGEVPVPPEYNDLSVAEKLAYTWLLGRNYPLCNIDPLTREPKAMSFAVLDDPSIWIDKMKQDSAYWIPAAADLDLTSEHSSVARQKAQNQVQYAYLNLCMARKLREHLDSIQVAFASTDELKRLESIINERALTAVHQYGLIARAFADFSNTSAPSDTCIENGNQILPVLQRWRDWMHSMGTDRFESIGNDFALAVDTLVESSSSHIELLLRDPEAQAGFGQYEDGQLKGPRVDVLNRAYGMYGDDKPRATVVDMSAPEVGVLLGLARQADALELIQQANQFDLIANSRELLANVESEVRRHDCELQGNTDPECWAVYGIDLDDAQNLEVRKRFNIQPDHAKTLVRALIEFIFGQPASRSEGDTYWQYDTIELPWDLKQRVTGNHEYQPVTYGDPPTTLGSTLHLDKDFSIAATESRSEAHTWAYVPPRRFDWQALPREQGFSFRGDTWDIESDHSTRAVGVVPVLAAAREALVSMDANATALFEAAGPALTLIEDTIGARSVFIRPEVELTEYSGIYCMEWGFLASDGETWVIPTTCNFFAPKLEGTNKLFDIDVHTRFIDPFKVSERAIIATPVDTPSSYSTQDLSAITTDFTDGEHDLRTTTWAVSDDESQELNLLATTTGERVSIFRGDLKSQLLIFPPGAYPPEVTAPPVLHQYPAMFTRSITIGGWLNGKVRQSWEPQLNNWSKPRYDAFGLLSDWYPMGDASLHGGQQGEEVYQYFLWVAEDAAREATDAIQTAYDTLVEETIEKGTLQAAEKRGSRMSELEMQALCGNGGKCESSYTETSIELPWCVGDFCSSFRLSLERMLGADRNPEHQMLLATPVAQQRNRTAPSFTDFQGGELQGLFVNQWSVWRGLNIAIAAALSAFESCDAERDAAEADVLVAEADYDQVHAEVIAGFDALSREQSLSDTEREAWTNEMNSYTAIINGIEAGLVNARNARDLACSYDAFNDAYRSGFGYSGDDLYVEGTYFGGASWETNTTYNNASWSPGALYAASERCNQAQLAVTAAENSAQPQRDEINSKVAALQARIDSLYGVSYESREDALNARLPAARARVTAADVRVITAKRQAYAQFASHAAVIQQAYGQLLQSIAAIDQAYKRADLAVSRHELEQEITAVEVQTRFALRRQYRSYELWRARALSENARRLAVAARRAIEARFVVDLSQLSAPEVFVESPGLWADEIYDSDLKPPAALGNTLGAKEQGEALYPNKLIDYVNNLQLFVNGYAVQRPTTTMYSDVDVVQLPGPAATVQEATQAGVAFSYVDPDSSGWSFYCEAQNAWIPNPRAGDFGFEADLSLAEICAGEPPTRARLGFWLDPWGRLYGHYNNPPYKVRHNVRSRRLALNLVGSGIRDCSKALDAQACYAEAFIRYELKHVGPAWITNHEQEWRELDLPIALIEGGKALSAEEWIDPVANSFSMPIVSNVARYELAGRPVGGTYELTLELSPDARIDRIQRIQVLLETDYWSRQLSSDEVDEDKIVAQCGDGVIEPPETCDGDCLTTCADDGDSCTVDRLVGNRLLCNVECRHDPITECVNDDGCCPDEVEYGCDYTNDTDCPPPPSVCGDGVVEGIEECDDIGESATCDVDCTLVACGDGTANATAGEQCDTAGASATCDADCTLAVCGDTT
ncbi:MAG: hypothetical protein JXA30_04995, partial [Deltaproteobacteria bacterium]|nr:hypothetical protein [Deltaproteobacteria bacterium]